MASSPTESMTVKVMFSMLSVSRSVSVPLSLPSLLVAAVVLAPVKVGVEMVAVTAEA